MAVFSKHSRMILSALLILSAAAFFLPFAVNVPEGGAATPVSGWALLSEMDHVIIDGTDYASDAFLQADGTERPVYVHYYALALLAIVSGLFASLFDRNGAKKYGASLIASAAGMALAGVLAGLHGTPFTVMHGEAALSVVPHAGAGLKLMFVLLACVFACAALGLRAHRKEAPAPEKSPGKRLSFISRVAVLGAVSAILYYFEVPVIPPIYKLDLSAVPALIAGFAMGPGAALGVMGVKDLIGLLHSSSMGVGELADFLMSGSMAVVASLIYRQRHTIRGALLGLGAGTLAITVVGALANYFIMIPFYVQVMNMPLDVILSLIAKTVPSVDSLMDMILMAVAPFNLLKGVVLSVVTLLLYKRISPMLKNL